MRAILWTCASLILIANIPALAAEPIDVGHAKQLFIDDRFMESSEGVTLTMNPPVKRPREDANPLLALP